MWSWQWTWSLLSTCALAGWTGNCSVILQTFVETIFLVGSFLSDKHSLDLFWWEVFWVTNFHWIYLWLEVFWVTNFHSIKFWWDVFLVTLLEYFLSTFSSFIELDWLFVRNASPCLWPTMMSNFVHVITRSYFPWNFSLF